MSRPVRTPRRRNRRATIAVLLLLATAVGSFSALRAVGLGTGSPRASTVATFTPLGEYTERAPHVASSLNVIGVEHSVQHQASTPAPDQPPLSPRMFAKPVHEYLTYSVHQLQLMEPEISTLESALAAGDRSAAEADWKVAWAQYLHLGGVYLEGPVASLNQKIDGNAGGLAGGAASPDFVGLHRIEYGLWTGQSPTSLVGYARGLTANVTALEKLLPHTAIEPLDFATRTHEILEDAVRDLLSGADVPWSGQGALGTQAGIVATRELLATLRPVLVEPAALQADPPANPRTEKVVDADLNVLQAVLDSLARGNGGQLPSNSQLTQDQSERLDAAVGQALEGLAQIPGMLETVSPATPPKIPRSGFKIDR